MRPSRKGPFSGTGLWSLVNTVCPVMDWWIVLIQQLPGAFWTHEVRSSIRSGRFRCESGSFAHLPTRPVNHHSVQGASIKIPGHHDVLTTEQAVLGPASATKHGIVGRWALLFSGVFWDTPSPYEVPRQLSANLRGLPWNSPRPPGWGILS